MIERHEDHDDPAQEINRIQAPAIGRNGLHGQECNRKAPPNCLPERARALSLALGKRSLLLCATSTFSFWDYTVLNDSANSTVANQATGFPDLVSGGNRANV